MTQWPVWAKIICVLGLAAYPIAAQQLAIEGIQVKAAVTSGPNVTAKPAPSAAVSGSVLTYTLTYGTAQNSISGTFTVSPPSALGTDQGTFFSFQPAATFTARVTWDDRVIARARVLIDGSSCDAFNQATVPCPLSRLEVEDTPRGRRAYLTARLSLGFKNVIGASDSDFANYEFRVYFSGLSVPDSISLVEGKTVPEPGDVIIANDENKTPAFSAAVKYSLAGASSGRIVLQLYDPAGKAFATGPPITAAPGQAVQTVQLPSSVYSSEVTSVSLVARLEDSGGKLLAQSSPPVVYNIVSPKITLTLGSQPINGSFTPAPADTIMAGGSQIQYSLDSAVIQASYDLPGPSAQLSIQIITDEEPVGTTKPIFIKKGAGVETFDVGPMKVPEEGTTLFFFGLLKTSNGQKFRSQPLAVPMETISFGPATTPKAFSTINLLSVPGIGFEYFTDFSFLLKYVIGPGGATLRKNFQIRYNPPAGVNSRDFVQEDKSTATLPSGPGETAVSYRKVLSPRTNFISFHVDTTRLNGQCPCSHASIGYPTFAIGGSFPSGASADIPVAGGSVSPTQNTSSRNVTSSTSPTDLSPQSSASAGPSNARRSAARDAAVIPDFIGVHRTWQFDPPIPADGSFSASLTLNYSEIDLPDDPNFDESKLQMVSFNPATGTFTTYNTTLDLTNKTATAQVNSLEPSYSLAVLGPFSKSMINLPAYALNNRFDSKLSLVNTGTADAQLKIGGYGVDGSVLLGSPAPTTVAAGKQALNSVGSLGFSATGVGSTGWIQAPVDGNTISGIATIGNGTLLEALPLTAGHASSSVITGIELNDTTSTEIYVVNPATNRRKVTINLYNSDGTAIGAYATALEPKSMLVNRTEELFRSIQPPFSGYAVVSGDGDVLASALLYSYSNLSVLSGHPVNRQASGDAVTLYGPQLGAPGQFTRITLVNTGANEANLTITPYKPDGSPAGQPVNRKLAAGQQFLSDLAQLFGFDPDNPQAGSFTVAADQSSAFGDLSFGDSSIKQLTRASIPLSTAPVTSAVLPFLQNDSTALTTVNIANPNSAGAVVRLTVWNSAGTQIGSRTVSIPANGFSSTRLTAAVAAASNLAAGYITLSSSKPVVSFAVVAPVAGSDFAAFVSQPIASAPDGGPPLDSPAIDVTPSSLDFGAVTSGQSKDLTLTVRNSGNAILTVNSITSSNPRFALASLSTPFNVGAGASQVATIRFSPTSAGTQSGTLTIASNDPAKPSLTMNVTGNGAGSAQAPAIDVTPSSLDFGSVTTGQTKDLTLTMRNNGNATLTVNSVTSSNPQFAMVQLSTPFNVGAGSFQLAIIRFSPTSSGAQSGALTIAGTDTARPTVSIALAGSGAGGPSGGSQSILSVDDGTFENVTGFPSGGVIGYFVNRLTPPSYPATLRGVQIFFPQSQLVVGSSFNVVAAPNPSGVGGAQLTGLNLQRSAAQITAVERFTDFDAPAITIQSGDFIVGFSIFNPPNVLPAAADKTPPSRQRSYAGSDGSTFFLLDSTVVGPANFGIRAKVDVGAVGQPASPLTLTGAAGWPNGRASNNPPSQAIDGNTGTYTWTTESFNNATPSYLGVSLAGASPVSRIRLFKDADTGSVGVYPKNLTIEYTTSDPSIPLSSRVWTAVTGLANGYNGSELMTATAVNSNGTVAGDSHNSLANGWASLTFNRVNATGLRVGFSNRPGDPVTVNHYRVYEVQVYNDAP